MPTHDEYDAWNVDYQAARYANLRITPQEALAHYADAYRAGQYTMQNPLTDTIWLGQNAAHELSLFQELIPALTKETITEIKIDEETKVALNTIVDNIIKSYAYKVQTIIEELSRLISTRKYSNAARYCQEAINVNLEETLIRLDVLNEDSNRLFNEGKVNRSDLLMEEIEIAAKRTYSIEHSKYKYYPRLKKKINLNEALLKKILAVTTLTIGKVICPKQ